MTPTGHVRPNGFDVPLLALFSVLAIGAGLAVRAGGDRLLAGDIWLAGLVLAGAPLVWRTLRGVAKGQFASDIVVDEIVVGDLLLVRPGEMVPCDAVVAHGRSHVDGSRLTGEPIPVTADEGVELLSGSLNIDGPLTIRATAVAGESQYARIVSLVRSAQESKAPLQRLADRYAVWFTPLTLAVCAIAWLGSGDAQRVLAVLVVVRHGGALEQLASVSAAVFDKTGTLTVGSPEVRRVLPLGSRAAADVLAAAASIEQGSGHLLARSLVRAAASSGVTLTPAPDGGLRSFVVIGGEAAGIIEYADQLRPGLATFFDELRTLGIERVVLLSGDSVAHTRAVADDVGISEARGDLLPGDKVAVVGELAGTGAKVVMIGDGTNDAPALSTANVGIALAGHGGGIVAEAADIVVLGSDVTRVAEAIRIARRTLRIAKQSIWVGLGLSGVAMAAAAVGLIEPVPGALLQEAIDVAVIVNALRTSRAPRAEIRQASSHTTSGVSRQTPFPGESTVRV